MLARPNAPYKKAKMKAAGSFPPAGSQRASCSMPASSIEIVKAFMTPRDLSAKKPSATRPTMLPTLRTALIAAPLLDEAPERDCKNEGK